MKEPLVDQIRDGTGFILEVALPGIVETDIDVMFRSGRITIRAERRATRSELLLRETCGSPVRCSSCIRRSKTACCA